MPSSTEKLKPAERRRLRDLEKASKTASSASNARLIEEVAQTTGDEEESQGFSIGFRYYRDDICQVKAANATTLRKVIEGCKNISRCMAESDIYHLPMDMKKVSLSGYYLKYAKGLTPDTEICEFDAGGHRGFFFIDRAARIVQMIAVDVHPPYNKQKS